LIHSSLFFPAVWYAPSLLFNIALTFFHARPASPTHFPLMSTHRPQCRSLSISRCVFIFLNLSKRLFLSHLWLPFLVFESLSWLSAFFQVVLLFPLHQVVLDIKWIFYRIRDTFFMLIFVALTAFCFMTVTSLLAHSRFSIDHVRTTVNSSQHDFQLAYICQRIRHSSIMHKRLLKWGI
jgi:hypothetical protein